jgi:hypothetical protein
MSNGELRISVPRMAERRGRSIRITIPGRASHRVIRLLFIGDIVGRPGRDLVRRGVAALREYHQIDLVIANAENAARGFGITRELGEQILDAGVDVMTSGNHIWDKKEAIDYIGIEPRLLRPLNFPEGVPGNGSYIARTENGLSVGVINAMGRVFMLNIDDPFAGVLKEIEKVKQRAPRRVRRLSCRGDVGKDSHGLASRRESYGRGRYNIRMCRPQTTGSCRKGPPT